MLDTYSDEREWYDIYARTTLCGIIVDFCGKVLATIATFSHVVNKYEKLLENYRVERSGVPNSGIYWLNGSILIKLIKVNKSMYECQGMGLIK